MEKQKDPSGKLLEEAGFWESLAGALDTMCADNRQTNLVTQAQGEKLGNELKDIRKKLATIEKTIVNSREKQFKDLAAAVKELETLRHSQPTLRKGSFTIWWEGFDGTVQKLVDIMVQLN